MGKNMGRLASSSSFFSWVPFWGCIIARHSVRHSAVELPLGFFYSERRLTVPDRLNLKKDALIGLYLIAYIHTIFLFSPRSFIVVHSDMPLLRHNA